MRYVDLAHWINDNVYEEGCDLNKVVEYLYILVHMLSTKEGFFRNRDLYDVFSMYAATRVYERLTSKKQYEYDEDGNPKRKKIENVLAFLKNVLGFYKADFQSEEFYQGHITEWDIEEKRKYSEEDPTYVPDISPLFNSVEASLHDMTKVDTIASLSSLPEMFKKYLVTPYKNQNDIYISCALTMLKYFQATQDKEDRFNAASTRTYIPSYYKEIDFIDVVTLYHLPPSMKSYIVLQCRILKKKITTELKLAFASQLPSHEVINTITYSGLNHVGIGGASGETT